MHLSLYDVMMRRKWWKSQKPFTEKFWRLTFTDDAYFFLLRFAVFHICVTRTLGCPYPPCRIDRFFFADTLTPKPTLSLSQNIYFSWSMPFCVKRVFILLLRHTIFIFILKCTAIVNMRVKSNMFVNKILLNFRLTDYGKNVPARWESFTYAELRGRWAVGHNKNWA